MLRVLVYSFATVAMLLCVAAVGFYIYIVRLPVKDYVNRGKGLVEKGTRIVKEAKEAGKALEGVREGLERIAGVSKPQAPKPEPSPQVPAKAVETAKPAGDMGTAQQPASQTVAQPQPDGQPCAAQPSVYVVLPKDTLYGIAQKVLKNGKRWKEVAEANRIEPPYTIRPGMKLNIPSPDAAASPQQASLGAPPTEPRTNAVAPTVASPTPPPSTATQTAAAQPAQTGPFIGYKGL